MAWTQRSKIILILKAIRLNARIEQILIDASNVDLRIYEGNDKWKKLSRRRFPHERIL